MADIKVINFINSETKTSSSLPSCCSGPKKRLEILSKPPGEGEITIDNRTIKLTLEDINIVDTAKRNGITIPAPCYEVNKVGGCCKSCVIEIDGDERFGCSTHPEDGMRIVVDRDDLNNQREKWLKKYDQNLNKGGNCGKTID